MIEKIHIIIFVKTTQMAIVVSYLIEKVQSKWEKCKNAYAKPLFKQMQINSKSANLKLIIVKEK